MKYMTQDNKKTILMVDDNTINSEMIAFMIGDDYNLKFATDGLRGLSVLKDNKDISLILLDLIMPNMNGREFLIEVKKNPETMDIPVIVMTTSEDSEAECLNLGAIDFIKKPFPVRSVLLARIENAINSTKKVTGYEFDSYINTLFSEYQTVYLIDATTNAFESVSADSDYPVLTLSEKGDDFFKTLAETAEDYIVEEDCDKVLDQFNKDNLMEALRSHHGLTMNYSVKKNGGVSHYSLKAMLVPDDNPQIIIGISATDKKLAEMEKLRTFRDDSGMYAEIAQALSSDYLCLYCVNVNNEGYIEYSADDKYSELGIEKSGESFFNKSLENILRFVHPDDMNKLISQFTKENVLSVIEKNKAFKTTYRLMLSDKPVKVFLKAVKMTNDGEDNLVVAVTELD